MKRVLPFAAALAALGLLGMTRGGAVAPARVEPEPNAIGSMSIRLDRHVPTIAHDWLPTPEPGRVLAPGESYKAPPVKAIHALAGIPDELHLAAIRIAYCESGWDETARIIDIDGLPREGAFMVGWWHGPVPPDLPGQVAQFARIVEQHGTYPFTTRLGCDRWEAE